MRLAGRTEIFRVLAQVLNRSFTLREALDAALPRIVELAEAEAGWIFLRDTETGNLSLAADVNLPAPLVVMGKRRMTGDCRCIQMLRDGQLTQPVNLVECLRLEQALPARPERHRHASVPLRSQGGDVIGLLNLLLPPDKSLGKEDLNVLEALGHEVAVAVQRARLFEEARNRETRTRELMQRLLTVQEDERRRIAQDLHDHAGQMLSALSMQLKHLRGHLVSADRAKIASELKRFADITDRGLEEIHKLVYDLRPSVLDEQGLGAAVRAYVDTHLQPSGAKVELKTVGADQRFARDIETTAYRIIQEATTNALRYADATRLEVRVDRRQDWLIVMVRDNGVGFDVEAARTKGTLGLHGMRERAELVGGTLQVLSVPGAGTTVVARLPFVRRQESQKRSRS
ncbi:MAG TPA: GAF domain-containing sensor histidine kinase [bacterium]|nr:GAF domain-containing sensor histidine kinase [bacterium]